MNLLQLDSITKRFTGTVALDSVNLNIEQGEIHALLGQNGAGKSTLIKIIAGYLRPNSGYIKYCGKVVKFDNPSDSIALGVTVVQQELSLCPHLSVAENIFLGSLPNHSGIVDWKTLNKKAKEELSKMTSDIDPRTLVGELSLSKQQIVEITKAVAKNAKVILMDEPTSALSPTEIGKLFQLIKGLKMKGLTILYISHKLDEVLEISDRCTILKDGKVVDTIETKYADKVKLTEMMIGRKVESYSSKTVTNLIKPANAKPLITLKNFYRHGSLNNINLNIFKGEVVGIYGLMGSGRTELLRAIIGVDKIDAGELYFDNVHIKELNPHNTLSYGIVMVPEERKKHGLFLDMSVCQNITISFLKNLCTKKIFIDSKKECQITNKYVNMLSITTPTIHRPIKFLSGGNQQKVVIARGLATDPKILLLDEPTRGVDVGSKAEIYSIVNKLSRQGLGILFATSEMEELTIMADRALIIHKGAIIADLPKDQIQSTHIADILGKGA